MPEAFLGNVSVLSDLWSPFVVGLWCEPMDQKCVTWCIDRGWLLHPDVGADVPFDNRYYLAHAARIAWFVVNGFAGGIVVEVSMNPNVRWYPVRDGNHRLAAAIHRGDKTIPVEWIDGPSEVLALLKSPVVAQSADERERWKLRIERNRILKEATEGTL